MKKLFITILVMALPLVGNAQQLKFGYLSYNTILQSMPEVASVQKNLTDLRAKYDAEMKHSEDEFNSKYEEFLDGQRNFAPAILQKRQAELQEMMEKNTAFKKEAQRLLAQAEKEAYKPLHDKLDAVIRRVAEQLGLAFVLNTDNDNVPYMAPGMSEDINSLVSEAVKVPAP